MQTILDFSKSFLFCFYSDWTLRLVSRYFRRSNIFDNMLAIMEKYASTLETLVEERTNQLAEEKKKTEALLLRMLPK